MIDKTLITERLILRAAHPDDAAAYAAGIGDFEVTRFLTPVPHPYTEEMAREWLGSHPINTPERAHFNIFKPDTGLIGAVSIVDELGYWIARPHWGQGYITEAANALLQWHFTLTQANGIASGAHWNNPASLAVQKKLGFEETGFDTVFVQSQQQDVKHVLTYLTRDRFFNRGEQK